MLCKHRFWVAAGLSLVIIALTGCTPRHQPTAEQILADSKQYINNEFQGIFLADKAIKENGYNENDNHYVAEMTIQATAQISLLDYLKVIEESHGYSPIEKARLALKVGLMKLQLPDFKAADQLEFKRRFLFIKTDNGWQLRQVLKNEPLQTL